MMQSEIIGQMVIPTERFSLRPARNSDVGLIEMFGEDKRLAEMTTHIPHPLPPGATAAFLDRVTKADSEEQVWAIDGSKDGLGELLGMIFLETSYGNAIRDQLLGCAKPVEFWPCLRGCVRIDRCQPA